MLLLQISQINIQISQLQIESIDEYRKADLSYKWSESWNTNIKIKGWRDEKNYRWFTWKKINIEIAKEIWKKITKTIIKINWRRRKIKYSWIMLMPTYVWIYYSRK